MKIKSMFQILFGITLLVGVISAPLISQAAPQADCHARLNDDPTDYTVLQNAIDASTDPNDVVKVAGTCSHVTVIDKSITIEGGYTTSDWITPDPAANPTTIDAQSIATGVHIGSSGDIITTTLRGLHIVNGNGDDGGGVYSNNAITIIENCQVISNTATASGGGVYLNESPNSQVINSTISNNSASNTGGIHVGTGSNYAVLDNNLITHNDAFDAHGGGIQLSSVHNVSITNNEIYTNTATQYGAGIMFWNVMTSTVTTNTIQHNYAMVLGGGMTVRISDGNTIAGNTFTNNRATGPSLHIAGGGIRIQDSDFNTIQNNLFTGNWVPTNKINNGYGGAIDVYLAEGSIITDNDFIDNQASHGNAIRYDESLGGQFDGNDLYMNTGEGYGSAAIYLTDTDNMTFTRNTVEYSGDVVGAFYLTRGDNLTLTDNEIHHNGGRGIYVASVTGTNLTVEDNDIFENEGGIHIQNTDVSIQRNNIFDNATTSWSGAGMNLQNVSGMVANNTVINNETQSGDAPGIYLYDCSVVSLHHNTIGHNTGGGGQGIFVYLNDSLILASVAAPTVDIINSIIDYQDIGIEVSAGTVTTIGDTLWGAGETATVQKVKNNGGTVNQIGTYWDLDPGFVDPQNGNVHLTSGAAAIDRGTTPTSVSDDIDGESRPNGSDNDLGADEYYRTNNAPTANFADQTVAQGEAVTLDGTLSSDIDGDALDFQWVQTGGTTVTFTDNISQPTFTAPAAPATLTFSLTVTDTGALSDTHEGTVWVVGGDASTAVLTDTETIFAPPTAPFTITVPAGGVGQPISLIFTDTVSGYSPPDEMQFLGDPFSLAAYIDGALQPGFTFDQPFTITLTYSDDDIDGLDESTLTLLYWDGSAWASDGIVLISRDPATNQVTFTVNHLTDFAFVAAEEGYKIYLPLVLN